MKKQKKQKNLDKKEILDNVLDGIITKKQKNSFSLETKSGKEIKFSLSKESIFLKMELSLPYEIISEKKIKWEKIKVGDSLSVTTNNDKKKLIALAIKQVIVKD